MTAQRKAQVTVEEYLRQDAMSLTKLEYHDGAIVAQAGASARHNLLVSNLIGHLYAQLRSQGCRVFPSDMRVQALDQRVFTYPDLTIVCGPPLYSDVTEMTLVNPIVIIEILSPSTENRDRSEKFVYYRQIETLQEYVLIAQHTPYVQRYTRQNSHFWYVHLTDDLSAQVRLDAVNALLPMEAIYEGISF
jgi:Uma2 family endonuclease